MYIKERNGKFRYFQDYKDPLTEKRKTVSCTLNSKSRAAQKQARIILTERIDKALEKINSSKIIFGKTIGDCIPEWLSEYRQLVKPNTYSSTVNSFVPFFRKNFDFNILINNLTADYISQKFEKIQFRNELAISTLKMMFAKLSVFLKWCVKHSYLKKDVINNIDIQWKKAKSVKITDKFLEQDELEAVLKYAWNRNKSYGALLEWLYQTGMRIGEALGLSFNDIEKGEDGIYVAHVTGTLDYSNNLHVEEMKKTSSTKTPAGMRDAELSHRATAIFKFLQNEEGGVGPLFQSRTGNVLQPTYLNTYLRKLKKILNIDKPLTTHIFRHTHISKLAELGVPLYVIQERVGHEDSSVTKKIYLHVTKKAHQQLVDKLDEL